MNLIPRPPSNPSTPDFVVIVFVVTVATLLVIFSVGVFVAGVMGKTVTPYVSMLTDITTTIIGALVGFLAGRGTANKEDGDAGRKDAGTFGEEAEDL